MENQRAIATTFISGSCLMLVALALTWAQHFVAAVVAPQLLVFAVVAWAIAGLLFLVWAVLAARNLK